MHPIERLRYVARATGADHSSLVRETAGSLGGFRDDPGGLVMGCRRMLARHLTCGPLWWLTSRACTASDPVREAWLAADEFDGDETPKKLARALPDDATICVIGWPEIIGEALPMRGDLDVLVVDSVGMGSSFVRRLSHSDVDSVAVPMAGVGAAAAAAKVTLIEANVIGLTGAYAIIGSRAAAAVAHHAGNEVWLVAGIGRLVPQRVWDVIEAGMDREDDPWEGDEEIVPLDLITKVIGPRGACTVEELLSRVDTPIAPELFKQGVL